VTVAITKTEKKAEKRAEIKGDRIPIPAEQRVFFHKDKAGNAKRANSYLERVLNQLLTDYQTTSSEREQLPVWEELKSLAS